jgi:SAM-dependent methyltransferase
VTSPVTDVMSGTAATRWADALAGWAIPAEIVEAAPEGPPWRFPPEVFAWTPERSAFERPMVTPSRQRALEAVEGGGTVLDVGAGGGRASLPLVPPASRVTAADASEELLAAFADAARREGVEFETVLGRWPDIASEVGAADLVVCHNVFYNVPDLVAFAQALTEHARRRVVAEITMDHPASNLNPLWKALHGIDRPAGPTALDAVAVLEEMGLDVQWEQWERQLAPSYRSRDDAIAFARRRLCVGPERDAEIDAVLPTDYERPLRRSVTIWWPGQAGAG